MPSMHRITLAAAAVLALVSSAVADDKLYEMKEGNRVGVERVKLDDTFQFRWTPKPMPVCADNQPGCISAPNADSCKNVTLDLLAVDDTKDKMDWKSVKGNINIKKHDEWGPMSNDGSGLLRGGYKWTEKANGVKMVFRMFCVGSNFYADSKKFTLTKEPDSTSPDPTSKPSTAQEPTTQSSTTQPSTTLKTTASKASTTQTPESKPTPASTWSKYTTTAFAGTSVVPSGEGYTAYISSNGVYPVNSLDYTVTELTSGQTTGVWISNCPCTLTFSTTITTSSLVAVQTK